MEVINERWWQLLLVLVIIILVFVPAKVGLPSGNYQGCDIDGSQCSTNKIKAITKESNGSMVVTVPVNIEGSGYKDLDFHFLKFHSGFSVGNSIFINYLAKDHDAVLFVEEQGNLLEWLALKSGIASQGATAKIDMNTMKEEKL